MTDLITWSGCTGATFFVKSNEIRGIKGLTISASAETKDTTSSGEKYVSKKNNGSYQITMTAVLSAPLGVNVQQVAMNLTEAARRGDAGYFYTANAKLFPSQFIATNATVNNITMTGNGTWTYCEVAMTLKQSGKFGDGSGSSGGGSSGGSSSSKKTTVQKLKDSNSKGDDTIKGGTPGSNAQVTVDGKDKLTTGRNSLTSKLNDVLKKPMETIKDIIKKGNDARVASENAKKNLTTRKTPTNQKGGGGGKYMPATKVHL